MKVPKTLDPIRAAMFPAPPRQITIPAMSTETGQQRGHVPLYHGGGGLAVGETTVGRQVCQAFYQPGELRE